MSYILEAIRRSEEARHKRLITDVATVHAVRPAAGRPGSRRLYVMTGVAVVLAVAAALRWWAWQAREEDPAVAASPAVSVPAPLADRAADPPAAAAAGVGDTSPALAPAPAAPAPRPENVPAQATSEPPAGPGAASTPAGEGSAEAKRPRRPYSSPPSASGEAAKPRHEPRPATAAPAPTTGTGDGGQAGAEAVAPPPTVSELVAAAALRELPPSVQRTLPSIAITLHRYAASANARMIRVNGRVAREGDLIGGDLSVAEITRSGVVFAIGEQRFYMDAFQTWQTKTGS